MVDKFYKIGEVSKMLDLPASTLRYWENQFKQLKPIKSTGGQRFYTSKHIYLLEQSKDMLHNERYTIEGAKQRLKEIISNKEHIDINSNDKPSDNTETAALSTYSIEDIKKELNEILMLLQ